MKVCAYCVENVLESGESWDYHRCYACLKKSSEWSASLIERSTASDTATGAVAGSDKKERCLFCRTLREDIETIAPALKNNNGPIYRWNIRSLAKIRESLETVVVTFRQVPTKRTMGDAVVDEIELPDRTFYLFPEDAMVQLPTSEELGPSTDPAKNAGYQIESWLETCNATHKDCMKRRRSRHASSQFVPTRLLDISGSVDSKAPIKIIETASTPVRGPYATLSHCWGLAKFVTLIPETKKLFMEEGVPWNMLTKNFRQTIKVARRLGIGYIWIDSLCIIQGPQGDFNTEGAKMHQVYRNSYCNIAIVDSADSTGGLFRDRDPEDVAPLRYQAKVESPMFGSKVWRIVPGDLWDRELLSTKLYGRGWVFQERMLAPRILHFAERQIFWDCPSLSACESLPAGLPQPMDDAARTDRHWRGRLQEPEDSREELAGGKDDSLEAFWKTAVSKYTSCKLTNGKDKTIAMWGIAKLVRDALGIEYGAGLWEQNLEDQLTWRVAQCTRRTRPSESTDASIARDIPSWSWASMDGEVEVPDRMSLQAHYTVKDHSGRPLTMDLVGVRRYWAPDPPRLGEAGSPTQSRGMSDSVVELQRRYKEMKKNSEGSKDEESFDEKHMMAGLDRDLEPKFHSKSIPIQGHIGRGRLTWDQIQNRWLLQIDKMNEVNVQAFPDTIPEADNHKEMNTFFVVLSAKQVVADNPKSTRVKHIKNEISTATNYGEPETIAKPEGFVVAGAGLLLKDAGDHHFHRTGAFNFRNISAKSFAELQITYESELIPTNLYNSALGRKFWLD